MIQRQQAVGPVLGREHDERSVGEADALVLVFIDAAQGTPDIGFVKRGALSRDGAAPPPNVGS